MSWTTERVELLKKLWTDGLSASQIAAELGGVTRNAVIGKVHRLGLSGRAKTNTTASKPRRAKSTGTGSGTSSSKTTSHAPQSIGATALKASPAPTPAPEAEPAPEPIAELVPISQRATILTLTERTCKWPIGDPATDDFYFCGRTSDAGVPYCAHHCKIAYQPVNDRRRDRRTEVRAAG
ncbi:Global cell cycle regulator GcrA [Roseibium hamelinense]|uniref:Global cell cycle regulator GcrA n=1 Tax=Roseibium hamelinense TaxID=150831 RepID=A0A562SUH0_9HYPH|nr:GcrA family cell cycle regulator [Roseibium hamelinense]MTI42724.1 GcrA cell cycle regulator [Roseibium hamelinense]TWI84604.1 Global cell cycle regulator GcrA [Roseibium hamelinense]